MFSIENSSNKRRGLLLLSVTLALVSMSTPAGAEGNAGSQPPVPAGAGVVQTNPTTTTAAATTTPSPGTSTTTPPEATDKSAEHAQLQSAPQPAAQEVKLGSPAERPADKQNSATEPGKNAPEGTAPETAGSAEEVKPKKKGKKDDGYYSTIGPSEKSAAEEEAGKPDRWKKKKKEDDGYYGTIKYAPVPKELLEQAKNPPPPPVAPPAPVVVPPPVQPASSTGPARKFDDDTGNTGSITVTRHINKAREFLSSGHPDFAKKHFKEALRIAPEKAEFYEGYYESCVKTNDWSEAINALDRWFKLDPDKEKDYGADYGEALFQLQRYDKATAALKRALTFGKKQEQIHRTLLKIAQVQQNTPAIIAEYNAVLAVKNDGDLQAEFGGFLERLDRAPEAIPHYKAAVKLKPLDAQLQGRLAYMLLYYNKDYAGAIAAYNKAIAADPSSQALRDGLRYAEQQQELAAKGCKKKK